MPETVFYYGDAVTTDGYKTIEGKQFVKIVWKDGSFQWVPQWEVTMEPVYVKGMGEGR